MTFALDSKKLLTLLSGIFTGTAFVLSFFSFSATFLTLLYFVGIGARGKYRDELRKVKTIVFASFGIATLPVAIMADTGVAILVILNGLRLFKA